MVLLRIFLISVAEIPISADGWPIFSGALMWGCRKFPSEQPTSDGLAGTTQPGRFALGTGTSDRGDPTSSGARPPNPLCGSKSGPRNLPFC